MESNTKSSNIAYTKDQLLEIREAFIACGGPSRYPVRLVHLSTIFQSNFGETIYLP